MEVIVSQDPGQRLTVRRGGPEKAPAFVRADVHQGVPRGHRGRRRPVFGPEGAGKGLGDVVLHFLFVDRLDGLGVEPATHRSGRLADRLAPASPSQPPGGRDINTFFFFRHKLLP